jgi:hypothetical protein
VAEQTRKEDCDGEMLKRGEATGKLLSYSWEERVGGGGDCVWSTFAPEARCDGLQQRRQQRSGDKWRRGRAQMGDEGG